MLRTIKISQLISVCLDAATRSGKIIKDVWKSGKLNTLDKGKNLGQEFDPCTIADIKCQQLSISMLRKMWPDIKIIAEEECPNINCNIEPNESYIMPGFNKLSESDNSLNIDDVCVFIDPLDGTRDFTTGELEAVLTLIGISYKGKALAGIMHRPYASREEINKDEPISKTYVGHRLLGSYYFNLAGKKLFEKITIEPMNNIVFDSNNNEKNSKKNNFTVCTTKSHGSPAIENLIKILNPNKVVRVGGAGHKAVLLLENESDLYIFPREGTKVWDTCAPDAIIKSLGGYFKDPSGNDIEYYYGGKVKNENGFFAGFNHELFEKTLKLHMEDINIQK